MRRIALLTTLLVLACAGSAAAAPRLLVTGAGSGHGVGMSQNGAYGYALHGRRYDAILAHYYRGTKLGRVSPTTPVRVLLATPASATFSGVTRAGTVRLSATRTYRASVSATGTTITLTSGSSAVAVGTTAGTLRLTAPSGAPLRVGGLGRYRGAIELSIAGGRLQVIDDVGVDDYVRGVVSAEMPGSWAIEALKTQAVAARTYALTTNKGGAGYDQFADTRSQVYRGVAAESAHTDEAVAQTRGQVVTFLGRPVTTYFFASSGGRTENVENGFPGALPAPWLVSVPDPYDHVAGNLNYRWSVAISLATAQRELGDLVQGTLQGIRVTSRSASHRVLGAEVVGSAGTTSTDGATLVARLNLLSSWAAFRVAG